MPAWVQTQIDTKIPVAGAVSSVSASFLHAWTSGHALAGAFFYEAGSSGATVTTIQDNAGNNYTILQTHVDLSAATNFLILFGNPIVAGSPTTLTINFSASINTVNEFVWAEECSGVGFIDASIIGVNNVATSTPTSGNITPTTTQDLLLGFYSPDTGSNPTAGSGFTLRVNDATNGLWDETQVLSSASPVAATFSQSPSAGTGLVGAIALAPPPEWGDELRGRQIRRIWHLPTQPDDISGFPFTTSATGTPANWGDIEQYIGPKRRQVNAWPRPGLTRDEFMDLVGGTPLPPPPGPPPPVPGAVNRAGASIVGGLPQNIPVNIPTDPLQVVMAFSGLIGAINQWIGLAAPAIANPAPQVYTMATLPSSAKPGTIVFVVDAPPGQRLRVFWGGIWNLV